LRKSQRKFLETDTNLNEDDSIFVIQYPALPSGQKLSYARGQIENSELVWDLPPACELHTALTQSGSSGSPILLANQKVFGIHMGASNYSQHNTLVRIQFLLEKLNGKNSDEIVSTGILKYT